MIVLDTHVWIWLLIGEPELSETARRAIEDAATTGGVLVAAISIWEVAMLEAKRRLTFAKPCLQWVQQALAAPGVRLAPLTPEVAVESSRLPGSFHDDPADRMIVATARVLGATLVTRDTRLLAYGAEGHVVVIPA